MGLQTERHTQNGNLWHSQNMTCPFALGKTKSSTVAQIEQWNCENVMLPLSSGGMNGDDPEGHQL
jgi:hypothetical protein